MAAIALRAFRIAGCTLNVAVAENGEVKVLPLLSRAGDFIELRAEMNLICGLTTCSAENSNNGAFKPIDFEIVVRPCNA